MVLLGKSTPVLKQREEGFVSKEVYFLNLFISEEVYYLKGLLKLLFLFTHLLSLLLLKFLFPVFCFL